MTALKKSLAQEMPPMIPPGQKTWVVGNEPVVGIDFTNLTEDSKSN